jgi:hypothetical protein
MKGSGRLPQAHRSGRTQLTHPALKSIGFTAGRYSPRPGRYPLEFRGDGLEALCLRHRSLQRSRTLDVPPPGPVGTVPRFPGNMDGSDFRTHFPPRLVTVAGWYPCGAPPSLSRSREAQRLRAWVLSHPGLLLGCSSGRRPDLPGSWGSLRARALLSDPGGASAPGHYSASELPSAFLTTLASAF